MRATKAAKPSQKNVMISADARFGASGRHLGTNNLADAKTRWLEGGNFDLLLFRTYAHRHFVDPARLAGMDQSHTITRLLRKWSDGERSAFDELMPLVYGELHRQAGRHLKNERRCQTLQTTALIHEAYLRLIDQKHINWESRTQFFAIAAQIMRHILVDHARAKHRKKRGGNTLRVPLEEALTFTVDEQDVDLIALDEALSRLAKIDKQQVSLVELRYFSGLTLEVAAEALQISRAKAARDWNVARAWLHRELTK
jgi:RNA polymerase sigma factor (TIGR02999 family)